MHSFLQEVKEVVSLLPREEHVQANSRRILWYIVAESSIQFHLTTLRGVIRLREEEAEAAVS